MIYSLKALLEASKMATCEIDGNWVPCRPLGWPGIYGFRRRVKAAWMVLTGNADAVVWPGGAAMKPHQTHRLAMLIKRLRHYEAVRYVSSCDLW